MLVLSLFPGIDLLGMAFEAEGFCVVSGPDLMFGRDVRRFHPPPGRFDGVIGGPPCQGLSTYAGINRARGNRVAEDLSSEFVRCVVEAKPLWFVMENVPKVPTVRINSYRVHRVELDARWLGCEQSRRRVFQFGTIVNLEAEEEGRGLDLGPSLAVLEHPAREKACMASEGASGLMRNRRVNGKQRTSYQPRRPWPKFCELQGLPADFLEDAPFSVEGKYRVVGNGVPLPMGRAIARAVRKAVEA